jgi:hypothetical protein
MWKSAVTSPLLLNCEALSISRMSPMPEIVTAAALLLDAAARDDHRAVGRYGSRNAAAARKGDRSAVGDGARGTCHACAPVTAPTTWRWCATSPSIWSAKSRTNGRSSGAASAPPGTHNTCWKFSGRHGHGRVNLDSLPCLQACADTQMQSSGPVRRTPAPGRFFEPGRPLQMVVIAVPIVSHIIG